MPQDSHNTIAYEIVISTVIRWWPSALWPTSAPMPLEPLHFPILKKVVSPTLLRNQTPVLNQLPHPHRRHTEDLSGLFRSDQAHLTQSCTSRPRINQLYSRRSHHPSHAPPALRRSRSPHFAPPPASPNRR